MEEVTLRQLADRLDRIEQITLIQAKNVLGVEDVATLTGYSVKHIYRLTSDRDIPHFKRGGKLYFLKKEVENWMTETRVFTKDQQLARYRRAR